MSFTLKRFHSSRQGNQKFHQKFHDLSWIAYQTSPFKWYLALLTIWLRFTWLAYTAWKLCWTYCISLLLLWLNKLFFSSSFLLVHPFLTFLCFPSSQSLLRIILLLFSFCFFTTFFVCFRVTITHQQVF